MLLPARTSGAQVSEIQASEVTSGVTGRLGQGELVNQAASIAFSWKQSMIIFIISIDGARLNTLGAL